MMSSAVIGWVSARCRFLKLLTERCSAAESIRQGVTAKELKGFASFGVGNSRSVQ
jgi:hypothetical protein